MNPNEAILADTAEDQRRVWASANFARVGAQHVLAHELLAHATGVHTGQRVLDVGAGTGNAALAAARRGAEAIAVDLVADGLAIAEQRAASEGFAITTQVADAQALPFPDEHFDVVLSTFAVIFAPDPRKAASELIRVCRPGGRIGLTTWTPQGYVGQHMSTLARHQARPGGTNALRWGEPQWLRRTLSGPITDLRTEALTIDMCMPSPDEAIDVQRQTLGPVRATFDALDAAGRQALTDELRSVIARFNQATDGTVLIPAEYLEITATKDPWTGEVFSAAMEAQVTEIVLGDRRHGL